MGNHQFGFMHRPPEFIGKSWSYVMEKRRKSSAMKRPNSTVDFSEDVYSTRGNDVTETANWHQWRNRRSTSEPNDSPRKPFRTRRGSIKPGPRGTMRCSPTVPEALTLSFDVAAAGIGVGLAAVAADPGAVASALHAIQKLTPAAPRLFKEPVFDDFFEEAERRNLTMEVLQAALIAPASMTEEDGLNTPRASEKRPSPARSLGATRGDRSKEKLNHATPDTDKGRDRIKSGGYPAVESEGLLSSNHKGRLVVIVGGASNAAVNDESEEMDGWDKYPPTLIVQPTSRPLFSAGSASCLTSAPGTDDGGLATLLMEPRRECANPNFSPGPPSAPLSVRFADQAQPIWLSEAEDVPTNRSTSSIDSARQNRRASFRRKTIGVVANFDLSGDGVAMSSPDVSSGTVTVTTATLPLGKISQRSEEHRPSTIAPTQQAPLRKKSLSKSDLLCPPPIITLLKPPQIILIRQLWQQLYNTKGPTVLGNHVFQRVFFKNPQVKDVFRNVDVGNRHMNVDSMCRAHAKAVAGILDDVVRNLDNLREVEAKLTEVGRKHAIFYDLGFHINFWSVFAEAFIDCTLEWGEKNRRVEESRKAWAIIIAYITDKMKFGFQEARRSLPRVGRRNRYSDGSEGHA